MVRIRNLEKSFGNFPVIRRLNMDVYDGDVYGFLGRNGCGKTTTMNIICDILPKDDGEIILGNSPRVPIKIGYLPESPMIFGYLTAYEYLKYIGACTNYDGNIPKRADEILDIVGLRGASNRKTKGYSRGMIQRLGMGAAIFRNPDLLIFDEPTSALDPQGRSEVINIINRLKNLGCTIILSTHILPDVEQVANRIGIMSNGTIVEEGEIKDILRRNGSDVINIAVRNPTQQQKIALLSVDFARAERTDSGLFRFSSDNTEECAKRLMRVLVENDMVVEEFNIGTATLDEVFRKVAG